MDEEPEHANQNRAITSINSDILQLKDIDDIIKTLAGNQHFYMPSFLDDVND